MNKINTLANLARNYGIENSGNLRDDIVSECTDILDCLDTVDESVINRDISLLPVYKINECVNTSYEIIEEGLVKKIREIIKTLNSKKETKEWKKKAKKFDFDALTQNVTPYKRKIAKSKSEMDKFYNGNDFCIEGVTGDEELCQILANILASNFNVKPPVEVNVISGKDFNKIYDLAGTNAYPNDSHIVVIPLDTVPSKDCVMAKAALKARYFNDVVDNNEYREYKAGRHEYSKQIQWIIDAYGESTIDGYAVDLESLKYVVESKECTLQEAIQEVRDVNYIGDTIPMYCTLPKNINENMTLESFITLNDSLNEAGIIPVSTREFSELEFVSEAAKISEFVDKFKDKIKNMPVSSLEKQIKTCQENNKKLKEEIAKIDKMSEEEAKKYVAKQSVKNIAKLTAYYGGAAAAGGASGATMVYAPLVGGAMFGASMVGVVKIGNNISYKGTTAIGFKPAQYKQALKNTIQLNNSTIASCKISLEAKK